MRGRFASKRENHALVAHRVYLFLLVTCRCLLPVSLFCRATGTSKRSIAC